MKQILEAVYENGVFRPLNAPKLSDGQEVQLIVYPKRELTPDEMLALAAQVYEGLPMEQINDMCTTDEAGDRQIASGIT